MYWGNIVLNKFEMYNIINTKLEIDMPNCRAIKLTELLVTVVAFKVKCTFMQPKSHTPDIY